MSIRLRDVFLVAALSIAWGLANFEFLGINYLLPFIAPDLHLDNGQIGVLISAFWVPFALSGYLSGRLVDRIGHRKLVMLIIFGLFCFASPLSGLTRSFGQLLACRLIMGFIEGAILPILQSVIVLQTPENRRATYMGIVQNLGVGIISGFIAPVLLVWLATHYQWRWGFYLPALPGLLCLIGMVAFIGGKLGESAPSETHSTAGSTGFPLKEILSERNIILCCILAILFVGYTLIGFAYYPLYLIKVQHLTPESMGSLMSVLGVAQIAMGLLVPMLADRVGRRRAAIIASLVGVFNPILVAFWHTDPVTLGVFMFLTWTPIGASILFISTIPSESVSPRNMSSAIGLTLGIGTLVGGGLGPSFAGWLADHWALRTSILLQAVFALIMCGLSFALRETWRQPAAAVRLGESHSARPVSP
jgi:MFS family permease